MTKMSPDETKVFKTLESLSLRFEALALSADIEAKPDQFIALQRFAAEWMARTGITFFSKVFDDPKLSDGGIRELWLQFLSLIKDEFPKTSPPFLTGLGLMKNRDGTSTEYLWEGDNAAFNAFAQGDACRWIAWLISEGRLTELREVDRKSRESKNIHLVEFAKNNPNMSNKEIANEWFRRTNEKLTADAVRKAIKLHEKKENGSDGQK